MSVVDDPPAKRSVAPASPQPEPVRNRYRRLVVASAGLVILAILSTTAGLIWHLRQVAITQAEDEIGKLVHVLAEQTARLVQSVDIVLSSIRRDLEAQDVATAQAFVARAGNGDIHQALRLQAATVPQLRAIFVVGADGMVLDSSRSAPRTDLDLADRDYFAALRDDAGPELFISAPVQSRTEGKWTIYVARRLAAPDGSLLGLAVAGIALDYFEDFYHAVYLGEGSAIGLNRADGLLLARYPPAPEYIGRSVRGSRLFGTIVGDGETRVFHLVGELNPVPVALAARRVPGYPLFSAVSLTESAMLVGWRTQALVIGGGGALAILATAAIAWLLLRHFASYELVARARDRSEREAEARRQLEEVAAEARASEARLRHSEEHLTRAQELGSIGSFERYFATGKFSWSAEMYHIFGVDPHQFELDATNQLAMIHEEDRARVVQSVRNAAAGSIEPALQFRIVRPDGAVRVIRCKLAPIRDEAGSAIGVVGALQDITEQKQSEVRLHLLQSVSLAVAEAEDFESALTLVLKLVCGATEWAYGEAWLPEAGGAVLGLGPVWHTGRSALERYVEERRTVKLGPELGHIARAWSTRRPVWAPDLATMFSARPHLVEKARAAGIVSAYAVPICAGSEVLAVARFATLERREQDDGLTEIIAAVAAQLGTALKQKRVEQALRDSEQMARNIIATSPDAFIQLDQAGTIIEWNPHAERLFGWTRQEAVGKPASELLIPVARRTAMMERIAQFRRSGEWPTAWRRIETTAQRRDGRIVEVERAVTALERADGIVFNVFLRDLTDKHAVENQLRQAQKMEAVGNLTGGLAHDFNNLLGAIIGNLDLLGDVLPAGSEQAEIAGDALHAALIGADLTRRLLAFARRQPLQPRATDLNDLVGGLSKMLRRILGEQIGFELNLAAEIRSILVDPAQLEAAITNLATNARDAMPRGGRLVIRTRNVELDAEYAAQNTDVAPGRYAEIAVSDTGTGMTPDVASQIFEPFFTTKEEGKGSGLGLSMVFGFVKQSGGHIAVESTLGEGTVVRLYLPAADHDLPAEPRTKRASAFVGGSETILVVEDNERMRGVVVRQLAGLGYRVIAVEDAGAALDLLAHEPSVDLLFTDIVMPGAMDGSELVREVADRYAGIRILLTSGFSETRLTHDDAMLPGPRLLSKPYRLEELARTIREVLDAPNLQVPSKSPMAGNEIG